MTNSAPDTTVASIDFKRAQETYDDTLLSYLTLTTDELKNCKDNAWTSLGGVPYLDQKRRAELVGEETRRHTESVEEFQKERDLLWSRLTAAGVEPLIILTKKTFERFREEIPLSVFHMRWDGKVLLSQEPLKRMQSRAKWAIIIMNVIAIIAAGSALGNILFYQANQSLGISIFFAAVLMFGCGCWFIVTAVEKEGVANAAAAFWADMQCRFLGLLSRERLLGMFMPDHETLRHGESEGIAVHPVFPPADEGVMDVLKQLRKNNFPFSVAAAPEAYDFIGGHGAIVRAAQKKTGEDAKNTREKLVMNIAENLCKLRPDPIILVETRKLVVIVGQYGEFPKEKAFIERLLSDRNNLF
jgi:hypothetical protein